jgi:hypothetical protein
MERKKHYGTQPSKPDHPHAGFFLDPAQYCPQKSLTVVILVCNSSKDEEISWPLQVGKWHMLQKMEICPQSDLSG